MIHDEYGTALGDNIKTAPAVFDPDAARQLREALGPEYQKLNKAERALVDGAAGCSPYLRRLMERDVSLVASILRAPPQTSLERACARARSAGALQDQDARMRQLRKAKDDAALAIALADIAGAAGVMQSAAAVSDFADTVVDVAITAGSARAGGAGDSAGIAVLAMGKHGAHELNYSSDIDLVIVFDKDAMGSQTNAEAQQRAVKAARDMVNLLNAQTGDGYVFRTDLRLRPDPGVSALAISTNAAEAYYEAYGQNWERMAYIKARAAAGDIALGEHFLSALRPFIWRKHLDFAAIDDVHAVKRQIQSAKGGATIEFEGHDIKLGRGGIREIEFFVQTQQLILGGKNPALRPRATLDALEALFQAGHISERQRSELAGAYVYFRKVEHRLQMINDEQTHRIPQQPQNIERLAMFTGEENADALKSKLTTMLYQVQGHYDELFRSEADDAEPVGPLVFTGVEADPATLETLEGLGFHRAREISRQIRRWHAGGIRATRSERARLLLTKLMPPLLLALSKASNPDDAFFAFAAFLAGLPGGVQVFSLLANNVGLFDTLIRIMTISPFLGKELSRRINFVEHLVDKGLAAPAPAIAAYGPGLEAEIANASGFEDALNIVRRWAGEQKFLITAQLAADLLAGDEAAAHFSAIADACINALAPVALEEMRRHYGVIDGNLTVVGLGRLGAREMTAQSDIDLMFIYDTPEGAVADGPRSLPATEYFTRLVRRIVTALSAATQEGALYEVDMQLRPSGGAGPAAVNFAAFRRYYAEDAWTWEIMALTKARLINVGSALAKTVDDEISAILSRRRERVTVADDVTEMRRRLLEARPGASVWDVKNIRGGLTDIAFICQFLALAFAHKIGRPPRDTAAALSWFAKSGLLPEDHAKALAAAYALFDSILHIARAATGGVFDPAAAGEILRQRLAGLCGAESIESAEQILTKRQSEVAQIYRKIVQTGEHGIGK